ncbi:MAG: flagellar motor switch protein FliN, partial [Phycisphaerales bacterium JB064]
APQPDVAAGAKRLELPDFDLSSVQGVQHGLDMLADVQLDVRIELGRTRMLVEDVLRLNSGAVVELDKLAGDPLDVYVNERLVARGEVLVLNDNFCIRINEIIDSVGEEAAQAAAN